MRDNPATRYGDEPCTCPHEFRSCVGVLDGISMGRGWVRLDDDPACPHHGQFRDTTAQTTDDMSRAAHIPNPEA